RQQRRQLIERCLQCRLEKPGKRTERFVEQVRFVLNEKAGERVEEPLLAARKARKEGTRFRSRFALPVSRPTWNEKPFRVLFDERSEAEQAEKLSNRPLRLSKRSELIYGPQKH